MHQGSATKDHGNSKAEAWDAIGAMFWELGRTSAKPSAREIEAFLHRPPAAARGALQLAVIGASTRDLVVAAAQIGRVTVFDFSPRMCADLRCALAAEQVLHEGVFQLDITGPVMAQFQGRFDLVLSDRLINRFTESECLAALRGMDQLAAAGGQIRSSIKLGLYPMDQRMLDAARLAGQATPFFDEASSTIDYAKAGPLLEPSLVPHGSIPAEALLRWYRGRGREKRYSDDDVRRLVARALGRGRPVNAEPLPDAPSTLLYSLG
jgi:hypothetical protein